MNPTILQSSEAQEANAQVEAVPVAAAAGSEATGAEFSAPREGRIWSADGFAREQLRGLVQQIFFSGAARAVRQVVISGADSRTDVSGICRQVGEILALETSANVVVAAGDLSCLAEGDEHLPDSPKRDPLARRVRSNLWLSPGMCGRQVKREMLSSTGWCSRLCELRREFEYSIVEGPAGVATGESAMAAQVADGLILVVTAHGTRRAAVQWIQQSLKTARTHLLGTILAERRFPIPEGIYRRL